MRLLIFRYLILPIVIIVLLLNVIYMMKYAYHLIPGYSIIGESEETRGFFSFWINVFMVAASTGMIIITSKSITRNALENENNRKLQINSILYQTNIEWINKLKGEVSNFFEAINDNVYIKFALEFNKAEVNLNLNFSELISSLTQNVNRAKLNLGTLFIGEKDNRTVEYERKIQIYYDRYLKLLLDLQFFFSINKLWLQEEFEEEVLKYANQQSKYDGESIKSNRIWEIIKEFDYNLNNYSDFLLILMRRYDIQSFRNESDNFIQYKISKANQILTNGIEQDKYSGLTWIGKEEDLKASPPSTKK